MNIDLKTSLVNVYGPGESGKSNFIKFLLSQEAYRRHLVFDPMMEYDPEDYVVYRPDNVEYEGGNEELNKVAEALSSSEREKRPRYFVVDEAANFIPGGNKSVGGPISRITYHNTHIYPGITMITANRHPTDLDSTIREMYDHMFVFGARGRNAKRALNDLAEGLSEVVEGLDEYQFAHVDPQGNITVFDPVTNMGEYSRV